MVFEIKIYRCTIIEVYIPILIILIIGLLTFYFTRQHYKKTYRLSSNFFPLVQNLISWGFMSCYFFMATNYYLPEGSAVEYKFSIKEKRSLPGRSGHREQRSPLVEFDYFDFRKELIFPYSYTDNVNEADSLKIIVRRGKFGFDIIDYYELMN